MNWLMLTVLVVLISLVWDAKQTLKIKLHPDYFELNRIMGKHPSDTTVKAYFFCVIVLYLLVTWLTVVAAAPTYCAYLWSAAWFAVEAWAIQNNRKYGL